MSKEIEQSVGHSNPVIFTEMLRGAIHSSQAFPDVNWIDAVSFGQLDSKLWLVDVMSQHPGSLGRVWVLGGWVGMLSGLMLSTIPEKIEHIYSIDIDLEACKAADRFMYYHVHESRVFTSVQADVMKLNHSGAKVDRVSWTGKRRPIQIQNDTIVNTSWEHFDDPAAWFNMIPEGKLVFIQANTNWNAKGHVSCPVDLDDLNRQTPFRQRYFSGQLSAGESFRLMTVGIK